MHNTENNFYIMKGRFYTIAVAAMMLAAIQANAQEETSSQGHLKFKQTEIKGSQQSFFSELKNKGFCYTGSDASHMAGQFAGQDVLVSIDRTCVSGTVYQVRATMKSRMGWNEVEADYRLFKNNLIKKYGDPVISKEKFIEPYRKGDGFEIKAAMNGKMEYISCWLLPEGEITIQIVSMKHDLVLLIRYTDSKGTQLQEDEKTELFLQDL